MDISYYIPKKDSELEFNGTIVRIGGFNKIEFQFEIMSLNYIFWIDPTLDASGLLREGGVYGDVVNLRPLDLNCYASLKFDNKDINILLKSLNYNSRKHAYMLSGVSPMDKEKIKGFEYLSEEKRRKMAPVNRYHLLDIDEEE